MATPVESSSLLGEVIMGSKFCFRENWLRYINLFILELYFTSLQWTSEIKFSTRTCMMCTLNGGS